MKTTTTMTTKKNLECKAIVNGGGLEGMVAVMVVVMHLN
jgi:hypothetical protein